MTTSLPANPSIENLRKQAKSLKRAWIAGDAEALQRIRAAHPQYSQSTDQQWLAAKPRLTDCQLVLAREAGFESWPQLRVSVASARHDLPEQLVWLGCLCFDDPHYDHRDFHTQANDLLRAHPWIASADLWSASATGNAAAVGAMLDAQPGIVNQPNRYGWTPLICACFSRVKPMNESGGTLEVVRLLLDRGGDPNSFTMKRNSDDRLDQTPRRFTLLTGLFGGGSTGLTNEPMHPQALEVAELLLQRGADPADEEAILHNPDACLASLLRYGLKPDDSAKRKVGEGADKATLMGRALGMAAMRGQTGLVRLLLSHGARTAEPFDSRTPWQHAMFRGNLEIARLLEAAGAAVDPMSEADHFVSLCLAGDAEEARAMLGKNPALTRQAPKDMVRRAVSSNRNDAVRLVLKLGFDPNWVDDNSAIHMAGNFAENYELLRILLAGGASLHLRDPWYDGTGIGWADFMGFLTLRDRMLNEEDIDLLDALDYGRFDRVPGILARDPAALERPYAQCLTREAKPEDWQTPLVRAVGRGNVEAVRVLLRHGADRNARHPDGRSLLAVAGEKNDEELIRVLREYGVPETA